MSNTLLIVVTILYFGVAFGYYKNSEYGMMLAFIAYSLANIGFILASRGI